MFWLDGKTALVTGGAPPACTSTFARRPGARDVMTRIERERGGVDVVVDNDGITGFEDAMAADDPGHATLEDWHAVHRTDLDGVFLGCKNAIQPVAVLTPMGGARRVGRGAGAGRVARGNGGSCAPELRRSVASVPPRNSRGASLWMPHGEMLVSCRTGRVPGDLTPRRTVSSLSTT